MSIRSFMAASWTLVILALCWLPRSMMPVEEATPRPFLIPNFDKLVHATIFAVFAFLWMRAGSKVGRATRVFFAGMALAVISELGQESSLVDRDASVMDGLADVAGVGFGLFAYRLLGRSGETPKPSPD